MKRLKHAMGILAILMIITVMTLPAEASNKVSGTYYNIKWSFNKKSGVLKIKGKGHLGGKFLDEDTYESLPWVKYKNKVKEVQIGKGIKSVGQEVFYGYQNLKEVTFPAGLKEIGQRAFVNCPKIKEIVLPEGLKSIGEDAFQSNSGLESIVVPNSFTKFDISDFSACDNLKSIRVKKSNKKYSSKDGVLFNKKMTELLLYPKGRKQSGYRIPETVKTIGEYAFSECRKLKTVTIPGNVKTIKRSAFEDSLKLAAIDFAEGLKNIEGFAFRNCKKLTSLKLPATVEEIGQDVFYDCTDLVRVIMPDKIQKIGENVFHGCAGLTVYSTGNTCVDDYVRKYKLNTAQISHFPQLLKRTEVKAELTGVKEITISWTKVPGAETYEIYCGTFVDFEYKKVATVNSQVTSYTIKNLTHWCEHSFKILCKGKINGKPAESYLSKTVSKKPLAKPGPLKLSVSADRDGKHITLEWKKNEKPFTHWLEDYEIKKMVIYRKVAGGKLKKWKTVRTKNSCRIPIKNLEAGKTYYFTIRAFTQRENLKIWGDYSNTVKWKIKR